jgi:hypothetical protein
MRIRERIKKNNVEIKDEETDNVVLKVDCANISVPVGNNEVDFLSISSPPMNQNTHDSIMVFNVFDLEPAKFQHFWENFTYLLTNKRII